MFLNLESGITCSLYIYVMLMALNCYLCEQMDVSGCDDHVGFDNLLIDMTDEFQPVVRHKQSP
jgi:hypothetical protein